MSIDTDHAGILAGVRLAIPEQAAIWGYGPVENVKTNARKADCKVLVDEAAAILLPSTVAIDLNGQNWTIKINRKNGKQYKVKLHGPDLSRRDVMKVALATGAIAMTGARAEAPTAGKSLTPPYPLTDTLMGGDAIYNSTNKDDPTIPDDAIYWGTIAYVSSNQGGINEPGGAASVVPRACVSCAHVLYHKDGGDIRTTEHNSGITAPVKLPGWPSNWPTTAPTVFWPDLAASTVDPSISVSQKEVRGLGMLDGVAMPSYRDVVAKYGATTGLTVSRDNGLVWRRLPSETGAFFLIRSLAQQFSRPGDSGAAVVYAGNSNPSKYRKLAGFVLAGSTADDEQYYLPAQPPGGGTPISSALSVVEVEL